MSTKLKALGLGVFAMLAMGAFGAMSARADIINGHSGGHFVSEVENTTIVGSDEPATGHNLLFSTDGGRPIDCTFSTYRGWTNAKTVTSVRVTPEYVQCDTSPIEPPHNVTVHTNGCEFEFTVNTNPTTTHNPVHINGCNEREAIVVTHPNCTIRMPEQTVTGVTYTNVEDLQGNHEITLDATVENIIAHYEGGLCVFLGTSHKGEMKGTATIEGRTAEAGSQVDITATGPQTGTAEKNE